MEFFRYTISRDMMDMMILVLDHYEFYLLESSEQCIESIIQAFQRNSLHTRMRIHAIECFLNHFKYS